MNRMDTVLDMEEGRPSYKKRCIRSYFARAIRNSLTLPTDMLGDDLLQQLSSDIEASGGLADFMEEDAASSSSSSSVVGAAPINNPSNNTIDTFLDLATTGGMTAEEFCAADHGYLNGILNTDGCGQTLVKSEPFSPGVHMPPSPSGSDSSSDSNRVAPSPNSYHPVGSLGAPMSPPYSPPRHAVQVNPTAANQRSVVINSGLIPPAQIPQQSHVVPVQDLGNMKLPIPKVSRPVARSPNTQQTPLILTQHPMAVQPTTILTANGQLVSAPNPIPIAAKPLVKIKTEPVVAVTTTPAAVVTALPTVQTISYPPRTTSTSGSNGSDMKNLKRQQRMIKNRESACLSRKKKKEYVTNLEEQLNKLSKENASLKVENEHLKTKIRALESERSIWSDTVLSTFNGKRVATTALMACLLVVSLNVSFSGRFDQSVGLNTVSHPTGDLFAAAPPPSLSDSPVAGSDVRFHGAGRSLLWANDTDGDDDDVVVALPGINAGANATLAPPICPMMYFNQSESIRLDNQLRGWFKVDQQTMDDLPFLQGYYGGDERGAAAPTSAPSQYHPPSPRMRRLEEPADSTSLGHYDRRPQIPGGIYHMMIADQMESDRRRHHSHGERRSPREGPDEEGAVTLYGDSLSRTAPRFSYEAFFEAIDRRDDTFYVVSFSGDHLLLPAVQKRAGGGSYGNETNSSRPKMSLILPSVNVPLNDSMKAPADHVAMMQIDCEVINTRLIHVHEDAIPANMYSHRGENNASRNGSSGYPSPGVHNSSLQRNASGDLKPNRSDGYNSDLDASSRYDSFVAVESEIYNGKAPVVPSNENTFKQARRPKRIPRSALKERRMPRVNADSERPDSGFV